jgi:hypothetical protein
MERARIASDRQTERRAAGGAPARAGGLQATAGNRAVQRLAEGGLGELDGVGISDRIGASEGGGSALDTGLAQQLAQTLGSHPGDIRIHTDGEADVLSQELGAKAFTTGRDIFFRQGTFDPASDEGFGLLAHEATHVLQQAAGPVDGTPTTDGGLSISDPGDRFERAASSHDASLGAPGAEGGGRAVQRDEDDWSLGSIASGASDLVSSAEKGVSEAADAVNTPFRDSAKSIDSLTQGYGSYVDAMENAEHDVVHSVADSVSGVPVLGSVAQGTASAIDTTTQVIGGFQEGAVDIAGGMLKTVADPYDAAKNAYGLIQRLPPAQIAQGAENAIGDLATGKGIDKAVSDVGQGYENGFNNIWGGITEGADPSHPGAPKDAGLVRQILDPFYGDVARGKSAHAVGRGAANIGAILFGGELAEAGEGALAPEGPVPEGPVPDEAPPTIREDPDQPPTTLRNDPDLEPSTIKEPEFQISPRNPKFAAPGSPGFIEQADPLAPTVRPPIEVDPGADSLADTRPQFTQRGIGPEFDPPPDTVPDSGPPTLRDGPPTLRNGAPPQANAPNPDAISPLADSTPSPTLRSPGISPEAQSVPGTGLPLQQAPPGSIGPIGGPEAPIGEAPISEAPATPNSGELGKIQDDFEKAWKAYSDEPFGYGLLPGFVP